MKEKINNEYFWIGYFKGKKEIIKKVLKFVEQEEEFLPDIHIDALLDRLVKFIKNL